MYYWEKPLKINGFLYALPLDALLAETIGAAVYLINHPTFLFQFLLDFAGVVVLGTICGKRSQSKIIYILSLCAVAAAVYFTVYRPYLHLV